MFSQKSMKKEREFDLAMCISYWNKTHKNVGSYWTWLQLISWGKLFSLNVNELQNSAKRKQPLCKDVQGCVFCLRFCYNSYNII